MQCPQCQFENSDTAKFREAWVEFNKGTKTATGFYRTHL